MRKLQRQPQNTLDRIIRCGTCVARVGKMPQRTAQAGRESTGANIMKTQHCDECKHGTIRATPKPALVCAMLHKPRFYAPLYLMRDTWGWKRKCEDFAQKDEVTP